MKTFWSFGYAATILTLTFSCKQSDSKSGPDTRPNIVFILSDDDGYRAISA